MKTIRPVLLALTALLAVGCLDVEQSMTLRKDLSGTARFSMKIDMEPMVANILEVGRAAAEAWGKPTTMDLAQARQNFLDEKKFKNAAEARADKVARRRQFEERLPQGVHLADFRLEDKGMTAGVSFQCRFDQVEALSDLQMRDEGGVNEQPFAGLAVSFNPFERPFGGFKAIDEGTAVLLTGEAVNPERDVGQPQTPQSKLQTEKSFKDYHVVFRLDSPMQVVESNATRKEGRTLVWEYGVKDLLKMTEKEALQAIRVRLRK